MAMRLPSSGSEPEAATICRYPLVLTDGLVVAEKRADRYARVSADDGADADLGAGADRRSRADVRVRRNDDLRTDERVRLDPHAAADSGASSDLNSRLDIRPSLDDRRRVHLGPVRDQPPPVGVLAIPQRLAVVVLDVDVVLAHDLLHGAVRPQYLPQRRGTEIHSPASVCR